MKVCMMNKPTIVNTFVLDTLNCNFTHSAIITHKTNWNVYVWCGGSIQLWCRIVNDSSFPHLPVPRRSSPTALWVAAHCSSEWHPSSPPTCTRGRNGSLSVHTSEAPSNTQHTITTQCKQSSDQLQFLFTNPPPPPPPALPTTGPS